MVKYQRATLKKRTQSSHLQSQD